MGSITAKWRGALYVLQVLAAVAALVLAVGIVFFGWATQEQVLAVVTIAGALFVAFTGLLAKMNLTPDVPDVPDV